MKMQKIDNVPGSNQHPRVSTGSGNRCVEFFIGWIKRFGYALNHFSFHLNMKDRPNL